MNGSISYPISQLVPSLTTGTLLAPPPATVERNVVAVASVTKARAPLPAVAAAGSEATVVESDFTYPVAVRFVSISEPLAFAAVVPICTTPAAFREIVASHDDELFAASFHKVASIESAAAELKFKPAPLRFTAAVLPKVTAPASFTVIHWREYRPA